MSDLLDRTIEAHGGLERWRGVRAIDVVFNFFGGLLDLTPPRSAHPRPAPPLGTFSQLCTFPATEDYRGSGRFGQQWCESVSCRDVELARPIVEYLLVVRQKPPSVAPV